jgi:hypothetical protein
MNSKRLFLALVVGALFAVGSAWASHYPNDYGHQRAYFTVDGPVVFGFVSSGVMTTQFVVGYKKSGPLGRFSDINVLIRVFNKGCNGHAIEHRHVINREWHDTGLLSNPLPVYYLSPHYFGGAVPERIELSFYKNDMWDSKHGQNYVFNLQDFYSKQSFPVHTFTGTEPQGSISLPVWNFIVGLMR